MEKQKTALADATADLQREANRASFDRAKWLAAERYKAEKKYYIPPQWSPAEMHERKHRAIDYSKRVRQLRRGQSHHLTKFVWKALAIAGLLFSWAVVLDLLVGAA